MVVLFRYEMKKLWSRKLNWVFLGLCLILVALSCQTLVKEKLGGRVQGLRDVYRVYEGQVLTDALAGEARAALDRYIAAHPEGFVSYDHGDDNGGVIYFAKDYFGYCGGLWQGYIDLAEGTTVEANQKAAAAQQKYLDDGHYDNGKPLTQADREYLKRSIEGEKIKPVIHYAKGWDTLGVLIPEIGMFILALLTLVLSAIFTGKKSARLESVLLCSKKRNGAVLAKLLAAASCAAALFVFFNGAILLVTALTYGLDGSSVDVSSLLQWYLTPGTSSVIGVYIPYMLVSLAAVLASAALAALMSAVFRHPLAALIGCAAVIATQFYLHEFAMNRFMWGLDFLETHPWNHIVNLIYQLPAVTLYDSGSQIMIISDPKNIAIGLSMSLLIAGAAGWLSKRNYLKPRKT